MRIAHLSDLHLLDLEGVPATRMLNKRITGLVNLKMKRAHEHRQEVAQALARAVASHRVDHVVVTGDLTNLSLESEFSLAKRFLKENLTLAARDVSVVPGNHDAYTRGAQRSRRFESFFGEYITSDLPGATGVPGIGRFPYVRLRGPVAFIGLSTAVARPPLVASGHLGAPQRMALRAVLAHQEVRERFKVILQHHPWHAPGGAAKTLLQGLQDAREELEALDELRRGLLLHGHVHRRVHRTIRTKRGYIDAIASTSASLVHADPHRMSGFNVYDVDERGLTEVSALRYEPLAGELVPTPVPKE